MELLTGLQLVKEAELMTQTRLAKQVRDHGIMITVSLIYTHTKK